MITFNENPMKNLSYRYEINKPRLRYRHKENTFHSKTMSIMSSLPIKKRNKNKYKEKCFSKKKNNKANKNSAQKSKIKNVYWSITAKITTSIQFPIKDCLTPHRYKINLRAHLGSR